jgi:glucose-6-phosphate isomerase
VSTETSQPGLTPAWQQLSAHAAALESQQLADLLADPQRYSACSLELDDLCVDFSRCVVTAETLGLLENLAEETQLADKIAQLFAGATLNTSEQRSALHTALRGTATAREGVTEAVKVQQDAFLGFAEQVRAGVITGTTGQRFRRVINIGIGGSDLGPRLVTRALATAEEPVELKFVAGIDGIELNDALANADAEQTLFIVCSKSFTTQETSINANAARDWLVAACPDANIADHFVAVSVNDPAMDAFGIGAERRFRIWDWVGGRYSVWSAVGLSAAIAIGAQSFKELLAGARSMDEHFLTAPFAQNVPLLLGMLGVWQQNFLGREASVVLPYDQRLEFLPGYLQQLYMESQGKAVKADGTPVHGSTGKSLWGTTGSHAQHSFAQWLHQGASDVVVEYLGVVNGPEGVSEQGSLLALSHMIAQAEALAMGQSEAAVRVDLAAAGKAPAEIDKLVPHKVHAGNRPSILLLMNQLNGRSLGALLAHYEHRVFVQSMVWGINPFDQWGVELGKQRATQFADYLSLGDTASLPGIGELVLRWRESSKS